MTVSLPSAATPPETARVWPAEVGGNVRVPGDKSIGHRALIIGALADGPCQLAGIPASEDVLATAAAVMAMSGRVTLDRGADGLDGEVAGPLKAPKRPIDCGNSGTGLRLLAGVAAGIDGETTLTGDESLLARPMGRISAPLRALGASVEGPEDATLPPLTIRGVIGDGGTHRSRIASAQVKSAVLLAAVRAGVGVTVTSPLPSRDHTERMLRHLGMDVQTDLAKGEKVQLEAGAPAAGTLQVPADPSSAAFWWVAAAIGETTITTPGVCCNPGRIGSLRVLEALGADVTLRNEAMLGEEPIATITVSGGNLSGAASLSGLEVVEAIDELPVLAIAAALSQGGLEVTDAKELRVKESDRIASLERLFDALGMEIEARPDGFTVPGGQEPSAGTFDARLDHRLAMSAAVAATVAAGPVTIHGFASVASSYPGFADDLERLGGRVDQDVA